MACHASSSVRSILSSRTYRFTLEFRMNARAITLIVLGLATAVGAATPLVMKRKRLFKK